MQKLRRNSVDYERLLGELSIDMWICVVQVMLNGILRSFPLSKLAQLPEIKGVVDALLPYTERHFQRLEDSVQRTYYIDFVLHSTSAVGEDGDEDEKESCGPLPFVIDVGKKAAQNYKAQIHELKEDDEKVASEGHDSEDAGDGDVEMAGWGDWGENGSDDAEEEDEAPDAHKSSASMGNDSKKRSNSSQDLNLKSGTKSKTKTAGKVEDDSRLNLTPVSKKISTAAKSTGKKKKAGEPGENEESEAAITPARTQEKLTAKTTGKKKKPAASGDSADLVKRRKSLDSSEAKGTPPVAKRLRAKA